MDGTAYVGLGSNLGERRARLSRALALLDERTRRGAPKGRAPAGVVAVSGLYATAPLYVLDQPAFLNAAARVEVAMPPADLLALLNDIEGELGRRRVVRFGPRTIDLDILLWDQPATAPGRGPRRPLVMRSPELTIPHPRLLERAFALLPLADVAADVVHPLCGRTIGALAVDWSGGLAPDIDRGIELVSEAGWHRSEDAT